MRQKVPESGVLKACLDLLCAEKIFNIRMNTGAVRTESRFFRFGFAGAADILATPRHIGAPACLLWIECKSDTGKQRPTQKAFQETVEAAGHNYLLVRDVDTLRDWLKEHGVI